MRTNLFIDEGMLREALELGGHRTQQAVVTEALEEYIQRRRQLQVIELFGTIDFEPGYDHRKQRQRF